MPTLNKLEYLDETKQQIKTALNTKFNAQIQDSDTFRSYVSKINNVYSNWPKVNGEGSNITLTPTRKGKMALEYKGNTYQESTTGKNLANFIDTQPYSYTNGVPVSITHATIVSDKSNNGYVVTYGSNSFIGLLSNVIEVEENTDYVFSFKRPQNSNFNQRMHILQVNNDNTYTLLQAINDGVYGNPYTLTYSNTTAQKVVFMISTNNTSPRNETESISEIMVRKSTTSDTFEPYTNGASPNPDYPQNIEVVTGTQNVEVCGKNFIPTNINDWESGQYNVNGAKQDMASRIRLKELLPIKPNTTYYFDTFDTTSFSLTHTFFIRECDINGDFINNAGTINNQGTFTTRNDTYYLMVTMGTSSTTSGETFEDYQTYFSQGKIKPFICLNSTTDKSYEEYQVTTYPINLGDIELCKIGTYQDRIYKQNNKYYLEKNIRKVIFDGSEDWIISTNFYIASIDDYAYTNNVPYSNNFGGYTNVQSVTSFPNDIDNVFAIKNRAGDPRVYLKATQFSTPAELKDWLSTHNTSLYYGLLTPTTTEITDTTLINQLNALDNAQSKDGQTNISVTGNLPIIISASALKGGAN